MAAENFDRIMDEIFRHEGGYVDHPRDPGGATNMGITIGTLRDWRGKAVTKQDVRSLTKAEASEISCRRRSRIGPSWTGSPSPLRYPKSSATR